MSMEDSQKAGLGSQERTPSPSNLVALGEVEDALVPTGMRNDDGPMSLSSSLNEVVQIGGFAERTEGELPGSSKSNSEGAKRIIIKEVQWSAFNLDSGPFGFGGFGSNSDFLASSADESADRLDLVPGEKSSFAEQSHADPETYFSSGEEQNAQIYGSTSLPSAEVKDVEYWEKLYPGWKYDPTSGQWYRLEGYGNAENAKTDNYVSESANADEGLQYSLQAVGDGFVSGRSDISFLQQGAHTALETIKEEPTTGSVSCWNESSYGSVQYPPNVVFDPQYPEWYFDLNTQQWHTLESYSQAIQTTANKAEKQSIQDVNVSDRTANWIDGIHTEVGSSHQQSVQTQGQEWGSNSDPSASDYAQGNMWQPEVVDTSMKATNISGNLQTGSYYNVLGNAGSDHYIGSKTSQHIADHGFSSRGMSGFQSGHVDNSSRLQQMASSYSLAGHGGSEMDQQINSMEPVSSSYYGSANVPGGYQAFFPVESKHQFIQPKEEQSSQAHLTHSNYGNQISINYSQSSFQGANPSHSQFSYSSTEGRSSAGRPPHSLVAFGFGGKIIVMREASSSDRNLSHGSQGNIGGAISIFNLMEVVTEKVGASSMMSSSSLSYFHTLLRQSFPGPLVGGNAAIKDVNKWLEERIMNCESANLDFRSGELLQRLLSLLKISCQHYGKLRSPFGSDASLEETDGPELAVTKLFASARKNCAHSREYGGSISHCMKELPSEGQHQATAMEVQTLLVSGRIKEALRWAQEGHLWGPALVLAAQLGGKFYVDTVKKMAYEQFISGTPLRTLCLLIAGQPADVFSSDGLTNSLPSAVNVLQRPTEAIANRMIDNWEENLAIIAANRTKDDELVLIHLGDCLWKERGEVTAAHVCYLVAEANIESYSDSSRLCLIGADHWKFPRTYASPQAIQRTELYEYSKVLGNSQYVLLPLQPYKFIYASMLAEVGKVSDSLRYCQSSLKSLKNSVRAPEIELWKLLFSSLEERLRTHQQGGYGTSLYPAKIVGKLFTSIDRSIHRMIGAPPPALPPLPHNGANIQESYSAAPRVMSSQSTMAISSLTPSASMEGISKLTGDYIKKIMHSRSISEPDFGRRPNQDSSTAMGSPDAQGKTSLGGPSRFGRFGSQLLQKTIGWVSKSHADHQAKLGESNKFYYDEKLRRWVEEGAEPPAEEFVLPPPPTTASFQNGMADYSIKNSLTSQPLNSANGASEKKSAMPSEQSSQISPMTPSPNQFSARGRIGVRSRYVDTFNKGGGASTRSFQSPAAPLAKPALGAKFFIPSAPATADERTVEASQENSQVSSSGEPPSPVARDSSFFSSFSSSSSSSMVRAPSMDNIAPSRSKGGTGLRNDGGSFYSHVRAASWGGVSTEVLNPTMLQSMPVGDGLRGSSSFRPNGPSLHLSSSLADLTAGSSLGDDLHEVEL